MPELIEKFGLAIASLICVSGFAGWLIRYVLKENAKREQAYWELLTNHMKHQTDTLTKTNEGLDAFRKSNEDAHKYQREEHMKMMEKLSER